MVIVWNLLGDFLIESLDFLMNFFGFSLDLVLDKVTKDFWVNGGFYVNGHSRVLCGGAVQDVFQFFCHNMFAGESLKSSELTGPTFDEKLGAFCRLRGMG